MDHWRVLLVKPSKVKILYKYYGRYESYVYYHVIHIYTLVIFSQNHIPARYLHASACFFVILQSFQAFFTYLVGPIST